MLFLCILVVLHMYKGAANCKSLTLRFSFGQAKAGEHPSNIRDLAALHQVRRHQGRGKPPPPLGCPPESARGGIPPRVFDGHLLLHLLWKGNVVGGKERGVKDLYILLFSILLFSMLMLSKADFQISELFTQKNAAKVFTI